MDGTEKGKAGGCLMDSVPIGAILARVNPRVKETYQFVVNYKVANGGNSPTLRAIGRGLGECRAISTSVVSYYLSELEELGLISRNREKGEPKGITVIGGKWTPPGIA